MEYLTPVVFFPAMLGMYETLKDFNQGESKMTTKFSISHNDPYFGCVTLSNPEDKGKGCCTTATYAPKFTYYCSECERLRVDLTAERNAHAKDNIENSRVGDHLRAQLAKTKKELVEVERMHTAQARTIIEKTQELQAIKERNLDPEPHALKAAVLVMQKQLDELTSALNKAKSDSELVRSQWSSWYDGMVNSYRKEISKMDKQNQEYRNTIQTLQRELSEAEAANDCGCDEWEGCECKTVAELEDETSIKQRKIEEQNGIIGAKQEEINNLKIALNKAKTKQTFEIKPAEAILRSYEDKIRRLIDVANSKDDIISGLQSELANRKASLGY